MTPDQITDFHARMMRNGDASSDDVTDIGLDSRNTMILGQNQDVYKVDESNSLISAPYVYLKYAPANIYTDDMCRPRTQLLVESEYRITDDGYVQVRLSKYIANRIIKMIYGNPISNVKYDSDDNWVPLYKTNDDYNIHIISNSSTDLYEFGMHNCKIKTFLTIALDTDVYSGKWHMIYLINRPIIYQQ